MSEKKKGRPLKETPNSPDALAPLAEELEVPQFNALKDTAFGLAKLPSGQYALVRIKYDAVSGRTIEPEVTVLSTDWFDAEERLKIALANELLR